MPSRIFVGEEQSRTIFILKIAHKKWLENESDLDDDEYELPILK